ncbi:MAG: hypothetical protein ABSC92_10865 [Rhizomicrobium sp.]|jgi:hypothetical protein
MKIAENPEARFVTSWILRIAAALLTAGSALMNATPVTAAQLPVMPKLEAASRPFSLPDTDVLSFTSRDGSHAFRLLIGLPRD